MLQSIWQKLASPRQSIVLFGFGVIFLWNAGRGQEVIFCWGRGQTHTLWRCLQLIQSIQPRRQQEFPTSVQGCCAGKFQREFQKEAEKNLLKRILRSSFLTNTTIECWSKWKSTNSSRQTTDHCTTILFTRSSSSIKFRASIVSAMPTLHFVPLREKKKAFLEQRRFFFCVCSASLQHHYGGLIQDLKWNQRLSTALIFPVAAHGIAREKSQNHEPKITAFKAVARIPPTWNSVHNKSF